MSDPIAVPPTERWATRLKCQCCGSVHGSTVRALAFVTRGSRPQGRVRCGWCNWTWLSRSKHVVQLCHRRRSHDRLIERGVGQRTRIAEWKRK